MAHIQRRGVKKKDPKTGELVPDARMRAGWAPDWLATYITPEGKRRSKAFARKTDAERWLTQVEGEKLAGDWVSPDRGELPFGDWAERYMATVVNLKPKTRAGYESLLRRHLLPRFGDRTLASIEPVEVREWVAELARELSASQTRQAYRLLKAVLGAAVESRYIARNPCVGVKLPRLPREEMHFLTEAELEDLADAAGPYRILVHVLGYGGLRWGEATALRRGRCDVLRPRLEVVEAVTEVSGELHYGEPKTYERRSVALPAFLREELGYHLAASVPDDPQALVFTDPDGEPLRHHRFYRPVFKKAVRKAGLPEGLRIHDLRHTCAALLIASGANVKAVQKHLGHSSATVTLDRYGHLYPDDEDRLAELLDRRRADALDARATGEQPRVVHLRPDQG